MVGLARCLISLPVEFNEDLSAFHGPTLDAENEYAGAAIKFILSLYPAHTAITVLAHSMGGAVAIALLPHPNISAIITMSTPHTLPPARLDRRVDTLYSDNQPALWSDPTPILSLCGGATDLMVPSESCILPPSSGPYRRTVFTSALEGSWTGVGHREMVWCHQVRWRVARAALELTASAGASPADRGVVLDTWLRDGHTLPPTVRDGSEPLDLRSNVVETLPAGMDLVLKNPRGARTYLIPPSEDAKSVFVLYVRGAVPPLSPRTPLSLRASVFLCRDESCTRLSPQILRLFPNPVLNGPFPIPDEGADESEGVVVFEADIADASEGSTIAVRVDDADGRGWVVGGFVERDDIVDSVSMSGAFEESTESSVYISIDDISGLLLGVTSVVLPPANARRTRIAFPNLLSNALVTYRLSPTFKQSAVCSGMMHTASLSSGCSLFPNRIPPPSPPPAHVAPRRDPLLPFGELTDNLLAHSCDGPLLGLFGPRIAPDRLFLRRRFLCSRGSCNKHRLVEHNRTLGFSLCKRRGELGHWHRRADDVPCMDSG